MGVGPWQEKGTYGRLSDWLLELADCGCQETMVEIRGLINQLFEHRTAQAVAMAAGHDELAASHHTKAEAVLKQLNEEY